MKLIGLVPAAGQGSRIAPLPMSKELYPVGFHALGASRELRPKVACQYLLERMRIAGTTNAYVIIRPGKWDIPAFLGDGSAMGMSLAYLLIHVPFGVPFSLDQAYPFLEDATVLLGFPDILIWPDDAYKTPLERLRRGSADVVLGLFPTDQPDKVGLVDLAEGGRVRGIYEKSGLRHLRFMWALAVWRPSFTEFLHGFVRERLANWLGGRSPQYLVELPTQPEIPIGDVLHAAIDAGLRVEGHPFESGRYIDIGTPEELLRALGEGLSEAERLGAPRASPSIRDEGVGAPSSGTAVAGLTGDGIGLQQL